MFSSQLYPPVNKKRGVQKKFLLTSLADCTPHFQIPGAALALRQQIQEFVIPLQQCNSIIAKKCENNSVKWFNYWSSRPLTGELFCAAFTTGSDAVWKRCDIKQKWSAWYGGHSCNTVHMLAVSVWSIIVINNCKRSTELSVLITDILVQQMSALEWCWNSKT